MMLALQHCTYFALQSRTIEYYFLGVLNLQIATTIPMLWSQLNSAKESGLVGTKKINTAYPYHDHLFIYQHSNRRTPSICIHHKCVVLSSIPGFSLDAGLFCQYFNNTSFRSLLLLMRLGQNPMAILRTK